LTAAARSVLDGVPDRIDCGPGRRDAAIADGLDRTR
jgi:hypothetical protein